MPKPWRNFGEGHENKIALEHTWMRDLEVRCVDGGVVVEKNIEVDKAWALGESFLAAHPGFYFPQGTEQCRGR